VECTGTHGTVTLGSGVRTAASVAARGRAAKARSVVNKTAGPERWLAYGEVLVAAGRRPVTADLSLALLRPGRRGDRQAGLFPLREPVDRAPGAETQAVQLAHRLVGIHAALFPLLGVGADEVRGLVAGLPRVIRRSQPGSAFCSAGAVFRFPCIMS
jgi:hypothetical protein